MIPEGDPSTETLQNTSGATRALFDFSKREKGRKPPGIILDV